MSRNELAEILAILGVDLEPLREGLDKAELMMKASSVEMLASVQTIQDAYKVLGSIIPDEGILNKIIYGKSGLRGGNSPQETIDNVLYALRQANAIPPPYTGDNKMLEADRQAAIEEESRMDAEILAIREKHDAMMFAEEERAAEYESRMDAEVYQAKLARLKQYNAVAARTMQDAIAEEAAMDARRLALANTTIGPAARTTTQFGSSGVRGTAYELQALEQTLGIRLPWAFSRIMATLPQIQVAMAAAFNVLIVVGFIDILVQAGEKLVQLTDYVNGWGEANQKAWAKADQAAMTAIEHQVKVQKDFDIIHGMSKKEADAKEIKSTSGIIEGTAQRLVQLQKEKAAIDARNESFRGGLAGDGAFGIAGKLVISGMEYLNDLISDRKKIEDEIDGTLAHQNRLVDERRSLELNMAQQREAHAKKMRDEVHEYPHILPWFMGQRSSDVFTQDIVGPSVSRNWQAPQSKSGISFSPVYAPQIHVQGTDVAHFRNTVMPQILEDLRNNSRGHARELARIMKTHG